MKLVSFIIVKEEFSEFGMIVVMGGDKEILDFKS